MHRLFTGLSAIGPTRESDTHTSDSPSRVVQPCFTLPRRSIASYPCHIFGWPSLVDIGLVSIMEPALTSLHHVYCTILSADVHTMVLASRFGQSCVALAFYRLHNTQSKGQATLQVRRLDMLVASTAQHAPTSCTHSGRPALFS